VITRLAKLFLLAAIDLDYALIVFDNLTDFSSNYEFVRHVLLMNSTFPGNHGMWRAIHSSELHLLFYWTIIFWEIATMATIWWGVVHLFGALRQPAVNFNLRKRLAIAGLTLSLLMWLVAFLDVGGEWFLMWQSQTWNGQQEAFRMFAVVGLVLLLLLQPDADGQP
jgi:predicted small integral membrane protein